MFGDQLFFQLFLKVHAPSLPYPAARILNLHQIQPTDQYRCFHCKFSLNKIITLNATLALQTRNKFLNGFFSHIWAALIISYFLSSIILLVTHNYFKMLQFVYNINFHIQHQFFVCSSQVLLQNEKNY